MTTPSVPTHAPQEVTLGELRALLSEGMTFIHEVSSPSATRLGLVIHRLYQAAVYHDARLLVGSGDELRGHILHDPVAHALYTLGAHDEANRRSLTPNKTCS